MLSSLISDTFKILLFLYEYLKTFYLFIFSHKLLENAKTNVRSEYMLLVLCDSLCLVDLFQTKVKKKPLQAEHPHLLCYNDFGIMLDDEIRWETYNPTSTFLHYNLQFLYGIGFCCWNKILGLCGLDKSCNKGGACSLCPILALICCC